MAVGQSGERGGGEVTQPQPITSELKKLSETHEAANETPDETFHMSFQNFGGKVTSQAKVR